jgi:hypothetical protein
VNNKTKSIRVSELSGAALDWAVAKAEGIESTLTFYGKGLFYGERYIYEWNPSVNWSQGGPIIERERICVDFLLNGAWLAVDRKSNSLMLHGPTLLIAAMRCYCCAKLGPVIDIPEELCPPQQT